MIASTEDIQVTARPVTQEIRNPQSAIRNWLALAFFLALTVAMTWPWALHLGEAINPFGDVVLQMAVLRWDAHALVTNPTGLFEAPFFYPYAHSIAFSEHLIGQTLVTLPFLLLTGNPALSYNLNVLLSFVLTGFFTYLLVRDLTGSTAAGLLSGVAFAFCPFRFMQMGHLHMLATAWFPFTLWALFHWLGVRDPTASDHPPTTDVRSHSRFTFYVLRFTPNTWFFLALLGFLAMGLSSVYYTFFLLLVVLLWVVYVVVTGLLTGEWRGWRPHPRPLLFATLGLLAVGLILLPVFLPYAQTSADLGVVRTTYELENWSAEWSYFGKVLQSNWLYGNLLAPGMATSLGERQLFFGIVPSILAITGLIWGRSRHRFYFAILGVFALLMTFGLARQLPGTDITVPLPYSFFYDYLPGFKALRVPVRFAVLLDFSIYVLAGYGLAAILRLLASIGAKRETRNANLAVPASVAHQIENIPEHSTISSPLAFRVSRFALPAATVFAIALVLLEFANPLDASNRRDVTAQIAVTEPYGWLSRPENAGPIMELPFNPDQGDVQAMLFDTRNWQPIVNGWSGFVPPGTVELSRAMASFPDPATISILQGLEVRHILVHLWQYPQADQPTLKQKLDTTPQLTMVDQAGDNYVYRLAPDPWLRDLAHKLGTDKTIWIGEARKGTMPTLEVLAYALNRMGVRWDQMGGNINIGYRPIGQVPFGTLPDYALVPNNPNLTDEQVTPVGLRLDQISHNSAVRVLRSGQFGAKSYDMLSPDAPKVDLRNLVLSAAPGDDGTAYFGPSSKPFWEGTPTYPNAQRFALWLLAFAPSEANVNVHGSRSTANLPVGVSCYSTAEFYATGGPDVIFQQMSGDITLLRIGVGNYCTKEGFRGPDLLRTYGLLPLEVTPSKTSSTLDTHMRAIAPSGNGDFTATIDVYLEPWGTHPDGHFGSWSVVLPGDDASHDYTFHLDPLTKTVTTERDGQPIDTFAWTGPPTQGDFRASLVVSDKTGIVANVPLYLFTLTNSRLTDWHLESPSLSITPVR
jgi:hypothetical protein